MKRNIISILKDFDEDVKKTDFYVLFYLDVGISNVPDQVMTLVARYGPAPYKDCIDLADSVDEKFVCVVRTDISPPHKETL